MESNGPPIFLKIQEILLLLFVFFYAADITYLVADSAEIGKSALASLGALSLIDYIVTDAGIEKKHQTVFKEHEIELIITE